VTCIPTSQEALSFLESAFAVGSVRLPKAQNRSASIIHTKVTCPITSTGIPQPPNRQSKIKNQKSKIELGV